MKIIIVYELPQRELENDLLLKRYLYKRGYDCDVVKFPYKDPVALRKKYKGKVDLVIVHSLYDDNVVNNLVYSVFGKVKYIVNMQVEQVGTNKSESDDNSYGIPKGNARYGYHVCWGNKRKNRLASCKIDESHLITCGPIQMDFLRKEFSDYYYSRNELLNKYHLEPSKRIALFISSFSYVGLPEYARNELKGKIGIKRFEEFEKLSTDTLSSLTEWFNDFLAENSNTIIIYRNHPAELLSKEVLLLSEKYPNNFIVLSDYSVKQWILSSDLIMTWYSTSIAEAFFANKSAFVLRPVPIDFDEEVSIMNGIKPIATSEELLYAINKMEGSSSLNKDILYSYFDVDDKIPSFIRLGNEIIHILKTQSETFPWKDFDCKKYDKYNSKQRLLIKLEKPYQACVKSIASFCNVFKIRYPQTIKRRLDNLEKEQRKEENQLKEIDRLTEKTLLFDEILIRYGISGDNTNESF